MKIAHTGHAELLVNNLETSKKFFTETMGLFITEDDDWTLLASRASTPMEAASTHQTSYFP